MFFVCVILSNFYDIWSVFVILSNIYVILYVNFSESKSSQLEFARYECRLINVDMSIYQLDISDISQDNVVDFSDVM